MFCCHIRRKSNRQAQTFDCVFSQCYIYHSQNKVSRINLLYIWGILRLIAKFLDLIFLIFILYLSTCWTGHVFFFSSVALQPQRPNRLWWTFDFTQFLSSEYVWSRLVPLTFHLPPCKAEWVHIDSEWEADHKSESCHDAVRNRVKPRAPVQNQQTRELINTWKTSHKHSNKGQSCLSAGMGINTRYIINIYIYRESTS